MPTAKIVVNIPDEVSYEVRVGTSQLEGFGARLCGATRAASALLITDSTVASLYAAEVRTSLIAAGFKVIKIVVPAGEQSKSIGCATEIWQAMAAARLSRDCVVVALGGGVVGDLAGFAASTYMRGVDFAQVPTTLLAMVDAAVGGKTGVNLEAGKNLVGTFLQPCYVCASTDVLATLPDREWACGCAEIVKSALIDSDDFFFWLIHVAPALRARNEEVVQEAIARCVIFKAAVVAADCRENAGVRECLNYGHTLGHAIESLAGYGSYSHGQAVAEGMRFAAGLAASLFECGSEVADAQNDLLDVLGLPPLDFSADPQEVLEAMMNDKKTRDGHLRFVVLRDVGAWEIVTVEPDVVLEQLAVWQRSKGKKS
ncbi:MAG: 3-dehydroquinate synthase [Raoultibacter sp.]